MNKMTLLIFCWMNLVVIFGTIALADAEQGQLTQDLTVGANHDIHLKSSQVVQVMKRSEDTAVIMVQLPDDSNGVYQVSPADVEAVAQTGASSPVTAPATTNASSANNGTSSQSVGSGAAPSMDNLPQGLALIVDTRPTCANPYRASDPEIEIDSLPYSTRIFPISITNNLLC